MVPLLVTISIPPAATVMALGVTENSARATSTISGTALADAPVLPASDDAATLVFDSSMARMPKPIPMTLAMSATAATTQTMTSPASRDAAADSLVGRGDSPSASARSAGMVGTVMYQ